MPSNHLILLMPSIFPNIKVFSNELALHIRWAKYWSFSESPSNEYSGLISFRIDWFDLVAVQGTLKSPLQHHSSKASVLHCLAFFMAQLWHPYMTTGKTVVLTIWTFVSKVMSLLFNMLTRLVIALRPRSKHLFNFMAAVTICSDFGAQENKVCPYFHGFSAFSKSILNIWKFMVHILLKPGLENFEHYFTSVWDECNYYRLDSV